MKKVELNFSKPKQRAKDNTWWQTYRDARAKSQLQNSGPEVLGIEGTKGGQRWREMPDAVVEKYDSADTRNISVGTFITVYYRLLPFMNSRTFLIS